MLIALHLLSTMKVSSKLATSSSSNPAVGETVACHAIEPRSPLGRHGGRERRGLPAAHRLRAVLAKFFNSLTLIPRVARSPNDISMLRYMERQTPTHYNTQQDFR